MNEETTLPPVKPSRWLVAWRWLLARPALLWVAAGLLTGLILPHVTRWLVG